MGRKLKIRMHNYWRGYVPRADFHFHFELSNVEILCMALDRHSFIVTVFNFEFIITRYEEG